MNTKVMSLIVLAVVALATLASVTYLASLQVVSSEAVVGLLGAIVGAASSAAGVQVSNNLRAPAPGPSPASEEP